MKLRWPIVPALLLPFLLAPTAGGDSWYELGLDGEFWIYPRSFIATVP